MNDSTTRAVGSEYLLWAKTMVPARYNLASSGIPFLPMREFPVRLDELELNSAEAYGHEPLQRAIGQRYGVPVECIVPAFGTSLANHLVMAALLEPDDDVLVERPGYEPLAAVAEFFRANVRQFERRYEKQFAIEPDAVERAMTGRTRIIAISNLHNPSSALTDDATLIALNDIAQRHDAYVLVDEVYLDALFESKPRTGFHLGDRIIVTSSLTKVYGLNGLRCGWIFAQPALANRIWRLNEIYSNIGVHVAERLSVAAFGDLERISQRSRAILDTNRTALNEFYGSRSDLDVTLHLFGTVSFPRLHFGPTDGFCQFLNDEYETNVVPGRFFDSPDHIRIGLVAAPATFAGGLERLGQALDEYPDRRRKSTANTL